MIRSVVGSSLKFPLIVLALAGATMVLGATQLRSMPVDTLPEFSPPYVEIQTEALGLSAPEVEQLITVPIEADLLNGVAGIDVIRSESVPGLSSVTLVFEPGTDLLHARQLVQERLTQAHALPRAFTKPPAMLQPLSSANRVMMVGLSSDDLSLIEVGLLARWTVKPRLLGIPGVANVAIWGQREYQLHVQVDPERLREHDVSLEQVISTTGNAQLVSPLSFLEASTPGTGGFIDTPNQRLQVRHILPIAKPEALARVPVEGVVGNRLRLGDVAEVVVDHQPLIGDAAVGDSPGLLLVIEKFPGAGTLEVTRDVEDALDALRPGLSDVEIDSSIFRPASSIETAIDSLRLALLIGFFLLVLVLAAVFREWRTAVVILVSVPLALIAATLVLALRGETMNGLVLAGLLLAVAMLVDDAVISVENLWRRLRRERARGRMPLGTIVHEASAQALGPITYATLIMLVALVPIFALQGTSGAFFEPLALSYGLALLASLTVALTVAPALALILFRNAPLEHGEAPLVAWAGRGYRAAARRVFRRPRPVFLTLAIVTLLGLAVLPQLDRALVPSFKDTELLIHVDGSPGTSRTEMIRITNQIRRELRDLPGVRGVGAHVGRAVTSDQVTGINAGELWLSIDPEADYDETADSIREVVDGYPGLDRELLTYSDERIRAVGAVADVDDERGGSGVDALTGADEPLVVRIYGQKLDVLRRKANEVKAVLAEVGGVVDPIVEPRVDEPTLEIQVRLSAARRHGIKPGDVRRAAATLVQGIVVGSLFEEQKVFEVVVRGVPEARNSLTSIRELLIDTPGGDRVRLAEVADVRIAPTPTVIRREAASRRIDVRADVRGRDLDSVVHDVERRLEGVVFPLEYHAEVLGASAQRRAAMTRALGVAVAAALAIFLLLQAAFGSWRLATVFFASLPFALLGILLAVLADSGTISLGALLGSFAVFAIAVRNGILIVNRCLELEFDEGETRGVGLALRAAEERLAPILMTAVAVASAVAPLVIFGDIPGHEIVHPMALAVLGGLVTSLLHSLVVVPAIYMRFAPSTSPERLELATQQTTG